MKTRPILGTFAKAIDGGVSINFGVSGGANCETSCRHHPESTAKDATNSCYAVRAEIRPDRSQLLAKLIRHEQMPAALVCGRALLELQRLHAKGKPISWVRFSTNGSLPSADDVRGNRLFRDQLRALVSWCLQHDIPVHIPVESYNKARFYRSLIGDLVVIRESVQRAERFPTATGAVSCVAGLPGTKLYERVLAARAVAQARREATGRKVVVCPAVLNSFAAKLDKSKKNDRAKCGACTACAQPHVDVVYPLH